MMFPKWKTMFLSDVFEKCAKDNSKTQVYFLYQFFCHKEEQQQAG